MLPFCEYCYNEAWMNEGSHYVFITWDRQGEVAPIDSLFQVAKALPISGYDIDSATNMKISLVFG